MNQSQFTTPIPIVCLDPIEHTAKAPYCLDSTCPCQPTFEVIKAWFLGTCAHLDATKRDVYTVHLLPGLKEPVWLVYEWLGTTPGGLSVVHPVSLVDGKLHLIHWEEVQ